MEKPLGIYIHIPFCVRKCRYCDFLSAPADPGTRHIYAVALCNEIREAGILFTDRETGKAQPVDTVFIGGGTPTTLQPSDLTAIMDCLFGSFDILPDTEITMEMNPGTFSESMLDFCKKYLSRVSIGLQSAGNEDLRMLGRIHTYEEFTDCYRALREKGISDLNIDLMSAIPGQTVRGWRETLEKVISLGPEHISAYSLIIEKGTPFYDLYEKHELCLPGEEEEREMYHLTKEIMQEAGFERYEISNYAKPGHICRHNIKYWRRRPYLGFGIGAASMYGKLKEAGIAFEGEAGKTSADFITELSEIISGQVRRSNTSDLRAYLECYAAGRQTGWIEDGSRVEYLTLKDAVEEYMFLGLRMTEGISEFGFLDSFGFRLDDVYGDVISEYISKGLLERKDDMISLTERGLDVSNSVMAEFLLV